MGPGLEGAIAQLMTALARLAEKVADLVEQEVERGPIEREP
jgi:hypothetical protein